jgi:hypothetical protein
MNIYTIMAATGPYEFTGYEHARLIDLLTVLAFISVAMWAIVCVSIVIRQSAILVMRALRFNRAHRLPRFKYLGRNNGS